MVPSTESSARSQYRQDWHADFRIVPLVSGARLIAGSSFRFRASGCLSTSRQTTATFRLPYRSAASICIAVCRNAPRSYSHWTARAQAHHSASRWANRGRVAVRGFVLCEPLRSPCFKFARDTFVEVVGNPGNRPITRIAPRPQVLDKARIANNHPPKSRRRYAGRGQMMLDPVQEL